MAEQVNDQLMASLGKETQENPAQTTNIVNSSIKDLNADLGHPETSSTIAKYLSRFGYLPDDHTAADVIAAFAEWQRRHGLTGTGALDDTAKALMMRPRCGHPDIASAVRGPEGDLLFSSIDGVPWSNRTFLWTVDTYTSQSATQMVDMLVQRACDSWAGAITNMHFAKAQPGQTAQIHIQWCAGRHQDYLSRPCPEVFDGDVWFGSDTLAHAWLGCTPTLAGDLHIDSGNTYWNVYNAIQGVVCHELGHILGLDHSDDSDDMMYSTEPFFGWRINIDQNDINRMKALYPNN